MIRRGRRPRGPNRPPLTVTKKGRRLGVLMAAPPEWLEPLERGPTPLTEAELREVRR